MGKKTWARSCGRPPTAVECALALVTASLAVATAMLALAGSAGASSLATLPEAGPYVQGPSVAVSYARAVPTVTPPVGPSPSVAPTVSASSLPTPTSISAPTAAGPARFMAMPVEGVWRVICGYRCGLHDEEHGSTFAVDISLAEGETAGRPVRSPVEGRVIAVEDSSTYFCRGKKIEGSEAGAVIIIDFQLPSGPAQRLRLVHIDPTTVPDEIRPDGRPVPVDASAMLGSVASMDRCSHLHISLTRLEGRQEVPELLTIGGTPLEDCDGGNCWRGALLPPQDR